MSAWQVPPHTSLEVLLAEWRGAMVTSVTARTISDTYKPHSGHIAAYFKDKPHAITKAGIVDYSRAALGRVHRGTVQKELSTLRSFLSWCVERELLDVAPVVSELPKRALGTRAKPKRVNTLLTPDEARGTIALLPEWATAKRTGESFPVRAVFEVAFETALRPATYSKLVAGTHFRKGWDRLLLTADIMKSRRDSELPINARARAALERVCPADGLLIFGKHDYRDLLEAAAAKAVARGTLPPEKARTLSPYDMRHSRATEAAGKTTNLKALQGLLDHADLKSTMRYIHPTPEAVRELLDEVSGTPTRKGGGSVGVQFVSDIPAVRRSRFELERPLRTPEPEALGPSEGVGRNPPSLAEQAEAILQSAAQDTRLADYVLLDFARDVLRSTELGRLALGVLDGGLFAPLRAVELAKVVVLAEAETSRRRKESGR